MNQILKIVGIGAVFSVSSIAWLTLGGVTAHRGNEQTSKLSEAVSDLWGQPQTQFAPSFQFRWATTRDDVRTEEEGGRRTRTVRTPVTEWHDKSVAPASSEVDVSFELDRRLKGLVWYALYDVQFSASWTYVHEEKESGYLNVQFRFPDRNGIYDDFRLSINGQPRAEARTPNEGMIELPIEVQPGQEITMSVGYRSRGMQQWTYQPTQGVGSLSNFRLSATTDFDDFDFAPTTMSPTAKTRKDSGWTLEWKFAHVVSGRGIGLEMPTLIQPGELASELAYTAPISLFFFFLILFVLATLRGIEIHPINYLFVAGGFFSFHLLFAYSVDHIPVLTAFAIASAVTILLVTSYLRLVVSNRFAFVEAAIAQLVYLVIFSLAHFFEGYTGLTVTLLSILTLAILMQLTGRIRWSRPPHAKSAPRDSTPDVIET